MQDSMASVNLDQNTCDITTALSYLQQQVDILQHENQQLNQCISDQNELYQRDQDYLELRIKGILQENDSLYVNQERLESDLYAKEQELDVLNKESQHWKRLHKDLNKLMEMEREEFDENRSSWLHRESQLADTIRLLQQQRQQKDHQCHNQQLYPALKGRYTPVSDKCQQTVTNLDPNQLPTGEQTEIQSTNESSSPENQGTIKAQEGIITTLRAELEQQANKLQQQRLFDNHKVSTQVKNLMAEMDNIKQLNQALMEENESYQMLLHEKTISGDFISDSMAQHQEYLPSPNSERSIGLNLADELALASAVQTTSTKNAVLSTEEELLVEVKTLQDANRALQLYMNKILLRIVENKHLENILSIDEPNKAQKTTTTIIRSTATTTILPNNDDDGQQTPMNLNQVNSRPSFSSSTDDGEGDGMSTSSSDTNSTKTVETNDDIDGDDSWIQVFRRMSSGFTGWTRSGDTDTKVPLDDSPTSIPVDHVVRTLYCLNK